MERLEILEPLAAAHEGDRDPDDADDRESRAASRVTVHLGQDDTRDPDAAVELAGALDRVLPRHRIRDVEEIRRLDRGLDRLELVHQRIVDVQPAGCVDDHDIESAVPRLGQGAARARDRIHLARGLVHPHARLLRHHGELLDGRRSPDVGGHQQRMTSLLDQIATELPRGRRLAGSLEPEQQNDARTGLHGREAALRVPEQRQHLVAHDSDDLLRGRQALQDFLIDGAIADAIDEGLHDLEVHVGFEQGETDLPERSFDRLLRQPRVAAERTENALKAVAE
jgi:hypothetical protein